MKLLVSQPDSTEPIVVEAAVPELGPRDVLVRVAAAAINPVDVGIVDGLIRSFFGLDGTLGLGWDVSGVVEAVGPEVTGLAVGDRVAGLDADLTRPARTHAELAVLPADAAAVLPTGLDLVSAASVPLNALTAAQAVEELGEPAGKELLVTGAGGAVGGYAVALAAAAGWAVTGLGRERDEEFVRSAGAVDFVTQVGSRLWDVVFDAAGLQEAALPLVRDGGRFHGVYPVAVPAPERGIETGAVQVRSDGARLAELLGRSASGELAVRVAGTVGLEEAAAGYAKVASGGQRGRWLIVP